MCFRKNSKFRTLIFLDFSERSSFAKIHYILSIFETDKLVSE